MVLMADLVEFSRYVAYSNTKQKSHQTFDESAGPCYQNFRLSGSRQGNTENADAAVHE